MPRKLFISFLGYSDYGSCHYCKESYKSQCVRYIQEATLDYLNTISPWTSEDVVLILLTEGAEKKNWLDNGHIDSKTNQPKIESGLDTRLKQMNLPCQIKPLKNLPDGNNETEIWEIFTKVFNEIQDGDELYFDLTHGFRYLPMLALVLGNYAKFLKNVTVKSLTYGNYEARDRETMEAQIIDLLPLTNLQDWTYASATFLENGNVNALSKLSEQTCRQLNKIYKGKDKNVNALNKFTKNLTECIEDFQTCRGLNIVHGDHIFSLIESIESIEDYVITPLKPVVEKIESSIKPFYSTENIKNGFHAAQWCLDNGLYQQAATILQENVVSFFAARHSIPIDDEDQRDLIGSAMIILFNKLPKEKWKISEQYMAKFEEIISDPILMNSEIFCTFNNLTEVRNDINHSGMRSKRQPLAVKNIRNNIEKCVRTFNKLLCEDYAD